jgi:hypothetical protein
MSGRRMNQLADLSTPELALAEFNRSGPDLAVFDLHSSH